MRGEEVDERGDGRLGAHDAAVVDVDDDDELLGGRPVEARLVWMGTEAEGLEEPGDEQEPPQWRAGEAVERLGELQDVAVESHALGRVDEEGYFFFPSPGRYSSAAANACSRPTMSSPGRRVSKAAASRLMASSMSSKTS